MANRFDTPDLEPRPAPAQAEGDDDDTFAIVNLAMQEIQRLTDRLATGAITVDEWDAGMQDIIATYHLTAWMLGAGTDEAPDEDTMAILSEAVAEQWEYLAGFVAALRDEPEGGPLSDRYRNRAEMYGDAIVASYWRGYGGAFRWPAYPGERSECRVYCRCSMRIDVLDLENGNADMYWSLGPAEQHCPQCPARAKDWQPFSIRGWEWVEQPKRAHYV